MTFIDLQERKTLIDLVVRYYDTLYHISLFMEHGANGDFPLLTEQDFIEIEQCLFTIEDCIDKIAAYLKEGDTKPPSSDMKDELTDCLQDIYATLNAYALICERIDQRDKPPS